MVNATLGTTVEETITNNSVTVPTGETWKVEIYEAGGPRIVVNGQQVEGTGDNSYSGAIFTEGDTLENNSGGVVYMIGSVVEGVDNTLVDIDSAGSQPLNSRSVISIFGGPFEITEGGQRLIDNNGEALLTQKMFGTEVTFSGSPSIRGFEV